MTTPRDADRILRAWLDLMPDEAPDRTVAAVLQAVETTSQTRRPVLRGPRRSASMNRFSLIAVAAVLGAALVGVALFAGGAPNNQPAPTPAPVAVTPAPSTSPSPSASADATAPSSLVGTWFGPHHDVPGILAGSGSRLTVTDTGVAFGTPNEQTRPALLSAGVAGSAGDALTLRSGIGSCSADAIGTYHWRLSENGTVLDLTSDGDTCAARATAFEGTWWKAGCRIGPTCLGDLDAGTYGSQFFSADHNQASEWGPLFGGIGFTVPEGWANSADWPSRFNLTPSTSYTDEDSNGAHPNGVVHEVAVYARMAAALRDGSCGATVDPAGGQTVADLERWIAALPDVLTTAAAPITIDGHRGRMLDLRLRPDATSSCPDAGKPSVELLTSAGTPSDESYGVVLAEGERMRLILLDAGGPITAIVIDDRNDTLGEDPARYQALEDAAMPIVESFAFK
jgi:hypothetical protein